jgi:hypothetical protein
MPELLPGYWVEGIAEVLKWGLLFYSWGFFLNNFIRMDTSIKLYTRYKAMQVNKAGLL